jgi:L-ascorbate metabolism protein UlaG (beta-lactamase superfamily)
MSQTFASPHATVLDPPAILAITRVVNACVLLQFGEDYVLTDPYFSELLSWMPRMREPIGLRAEALPRLAAILGGHSAPDHWHLSSIDAYPYKDTTPVFCASRTAARRARAAGFANVEHLDWNESRAITPMLRLEVAPAQESGGSLANNYVLTTPAIRVFVGTEACELEPIVDYRRKNPPVQVALLPIDASALFGHKLVMNAAEAIAAARVLGAHVLVPIHYSLKPIPMIFQTPGSEEDLQRLAPTAPEIDIRRLRTGERWLYPSAPPFASQRRNGRALAV